MSKKLKDLSYEQAKRFSLYEAFAQTIVGGVINWLATVWILPRWGFEPTYVEAFEITLLFFFISLARQYLLRRAFTHIKES